MAKKKVLKIQIGEAYDKETRKGLPVYVTAWQQEDGSYTITQKVYVNEVEVKDRNDVQLEVKET